MFKKILILIPIIILIISTTLTKNSTKQLDKKIFETQEELRALEDIYELVLLDYNYLTSPSKLMEYSQKYFDEELKKKKILDLKTFIYKNE
jgi:ribosome assembly protein YihI (activator of Der GTPase)